MPITFFGEKMLLTFFCSFKIVQMAVLLIPKYKWVRRAYYLSQVLQTLGFLITFEVFLMPLIQLSNISYSFRDSKNQFECSVHTWSCSCHCSGITLRNSSYLGSFSKKSALVADNNKKVIKIWHINDHDHLPTTF